MTTAEILLNWLLGGEGRGIIRRGPLWIAKDVKSGDSISAHSAERLAQMIAGKPLAQG